MMGEDEEVSSQPVLWRCECGRDFRSRGAWATHATRLVKWTLPHRLRGDRNAIAAEMKLAQTRPHLLGGWVVAEPERPQ